MKFKFTSIVIATFLAMLVMPLQAAEGVAPKAFSFLSDVISGGYNVTNPACASCFTNARWGGFTVSNAAAAPFGGYTNVKSWGLYGLGGTNSARMTWTNNQGIWVIPTNNVPGTVTGVSFTTNLIEDLTKDVPLWATTTGMLPFTTTTNEALLYGSAVPNIKLVCRLSGAASAATALNFIFVGLPDGELEPSSATVGAIPAFQWGVVPAAGVTIYETNFPIWKFAGCAAVRLRSATLTTATAADIGVTIQALRLTGFYP